MTKLDQELVVRLQARLEAEKKTLEVELGKFAKPTGTEDVFQAQMEEIGSEVDDNANEVEEYVSHLALEGNLEGQLKEINRALERIKDGTYGFCANCGQEIGHDRLEAYPAAVNCLHCR